MKKKIEKKTILKISTVVLLFVVVGLFFLLKASYALDNGSRVEPESELIYYIDVVYDGKDSNGATSNENTVANVYSNYIYVEDKLPNGLTFEGFVETDDKTIGAVQYGDDTKSCGGYVVGGTDGLSYDTDTGLVSFKVKNLMAGCKITVGIVTQTPKDEGKRIDFYNTANANEGSDSVVSNTVHLYLGDEREPLYNVTYEFEGTVPMGAQGLLPNLASYVKDSVVDVANNITIDGYTFSGWRIKEGSTTITGDNTFIMPEENVVLVGSFEKSNVAEYTVHYEITGDVPEGFIVPKDHNYPVNSDVIVDSLKDGDRVGNYIFKGWSVQQGVDVSANDEDTTFKMPNHNVTIVGRFEKVTREVRYEFTGAIIPEGATLPSSSRHEVGEKVTVASDPVMPGYKFLGWYSEKEFTMPDEDVVIKGEWMVELGTFSPTITKEIVDEKEYYHQGDIVKFKITVTNTADFAINTIQLVERLENAYFVAGDGYEVKTSTYVEIPSLEANASIVVYAEYVAGDEILINKENVVELTGAFAENGYHLDTSNDYLAKDEFNVANISLVVNKINENNENLEGASFGLYSDSGATNLLQSGLTFTNLDPNKTYYLREMVAPTGYKLSTNIIPIRVSDDGSISADNYTIKNENGVGHIDVVNTPIYILPETGGSGITPIIIGGLVVAIVGAGGYGFYTYRKGKKK